MCSSTTSCVEAAAESAKALAVWSGVILAGIAAHCVLIMCSSQLVEHMCTYLV